MSHRRCSGLTRPDPLTPRPGPGPRCGPRCPMWNGTPLPQREELKLIQVSQRVEPNRSPAGTRRGAARPSAAPRVCRCLIRKDPGKKCRKWPSRQASKIADQRGLVFIPELTTPFPSLLLLLGLPLSLLLFCSFRTPQLTRRVATPPTTRTANTCTTLIQSCAPTSCSSKASTMSATSPSAALAVPAAPPNRRRGAAAEPEPEAET